jgi:hypothetical protein
MDIAERVLHIYVGPGKTLLGRNESFVCLSKGEFTSQLIRSLLQMRKRGAAPARLATSTLESLKFLLTNRKPSQRYIPMLLDLRQIYGEYNLAIAE